MLALLAREGECSAGDLGRPFAISQPTTSKHLRVQERASLVSRYISGRVHRFRLNMQPIQEAEEWMKRQRKYWECALDSLEAFLDKPEDS
jgi:DNA-binding transcriptional ArsR family regulator